MLFLSQDSVRIGGRGWEEQGSQEIGVSMTREKGEVWIVAVIPCRRL